MARTPPPLRLEMFIVASCLLCYLEMSGGKSEIMAFMSRGAPPRQHEKAKSCVLDLGLGVLDLEGNGLWGMITANRILKNRFAI